VYTPSNEAIIGVIAAAITPKLDEVRHGKVEGNEPSEIQIARIALTIINHMSDLT
jgi:hypothetical protein